MPFADKIPYEALTVIPAVGNASNVAVGAARLGLKTAILTSIGDDVYGKEVLGVYKKEGVKTEFVKVNKNKRTNYNFVLTYKAERTILVKHEDYVYEDPKNIGATTDWIYFSSVGEHTLPFHEKIVRYLKAHPGVRMGFNPGTFQIRFGAEKLKGIYAKTYVVFVNREEAEMVLGMKEGTDMKFLLGGLHKLGPKIAIITDGPNGAYASDGTHQYFMPPCVDLTPPVSMTGAGDAFSTGFLSALICGLSVPEALRWAPIESLNVIQFFGAQAGLLSKSKLLQLVKKAPKDFVPKEL
jgi:sugar/nucleoside kinase (ribokinase family)